MNFNSLSYFLFLPVMLALYYGLPARWKNPVLLGASYLFYMGWGPSHALLLLFCSLTTWGCGLLMEGRGAGRRRLWLLLTLLLNFGLLFVFKYFDFFSGLLSRLPGAGPLPRLNLLLPVGISFFTFQSVGYAIDVYRGTVPAERSFSDYALFVSFFPQLVAGPIDRAGSLLPQLKRARRFSDGNLKAGALRFLWGLMKKMILADQLAVVVDTAFGNLEAFNGGQLTFAALCFTFQIYCDFSAYSDIAVGSARMLGVELMENFRFPYGARSLRDFWRRWHISLSSWFKDYLYFPLGGSRVPAWRHCLNLLIVFTVSGLWHGAAVTFILWGALHGLCQAAGIALTPVRERLYRRFPRESLPVRAVSHAGTFLLVSVFWVFFRAQRVEDALYLLRAAAGFVLHPYVPMLSALGQSKPMLAVLLCYLLLLTAVIALNAVHAF